MKWRKACISAATILVALLVASCGAAPRLTMTPETKLADGGPGATAKSRDVRVVATLDEWRWNPEELDEFVTPMHLEIRNDSNRPVRVRFSDIRLMGRGGVHLAALPPYRIEGKVTRTVPSERYQFDNFFVAPYLEEYYDEANLSDDLYYTDFYYYDSYYPVFERYAIELPTREMVDRALPEGTLEPGGRLSGFVYFERLTRKVARKTDRLDLVVRISDAEQHRELGIVKIPLAVER